MPRVSAAALRMPPTAAQTPVTRERSRGSRERADRQDPTQRQRPCVLSSPSRSLPSSPSCNSNIPPCDHDACEQPIRQSPLTRPAIMSQITPSKRAPGATHEESPALKKSTIHDLIGLEHAWIALDLAWLAACDSVSVSLGCSRSLSLPNQQAALDPHSIRPILRHWGSVCVWRRALSLGIPSLGQRRTRVSGCVHVCVCCSPPSREIAPRTHRDRTETHRDCAEIAPRSHRGHTETRLALVRDPRCFSFAASPDRHFHPLPRHPLPSAHQPSVLFVFPPLLLCWAPAVADDLSDVR
ncbi:uncharacterized protein BJ171DRAFT_58147 [Polychytrium aggregatum]|uniref:uncharacterized protein n=1 Tax=Polychytrium aggregatum TaxID=110093 RepID=UPI0022FF21F9|nr:uncharacterized protein BJ171DRAFT_58147 [Polychytrium aggregatum]KAI9190728.1 hypothetical protein BJ171DRAFT_58147 [Polychytrium aggregatum]